MRNSDQYRQMGAACLRAAESMMDPGAKASMLDMARGWQFLANQADRNSKFGLVYETPPANDRIRAAGRAPTAADTAKKGRAGRPEHRTLERRRATKD
jgi:hypothetical protein